MIEEIKKTEAGPDSARYILMGMTHVVKKTDTETLYYGVNHLDSTTLVTDETGKIVNELTDKTNPFGDQKEKGMFFTGKRWDEDAQLFYFNARWYDPETGGFITEDPVKDGLLWYAYCNNNPLKYIDPTGLLFEKLRERWAERKASKADDKKNKAGGSDSGSGSRNDDDDHKDSSSQEQSRREVEEYYDYLRNRNTFGPDPDSLNDALNYNEYGQSPYQLDKIQEEVDAHLGSAGGLYGKENMCDDWAKDRLDNAGVDTSDLFAGDPNSTNVATDIENAQDKGLGSSSPKEGWSLVFMGKSKAGLGEHAGLLKMNSDGSGTFYDSSSTNTDNLPQGHNFENFDDKFSKRGGDRYGHYVTQIFIPVKP